MKSLFFAATFSLLTFATPALAEKCICNGEEYEVGDQLIESPRADMIMQNTIQITRILCTNDPASPNRCRMGGDYCYVDADILDTAHQGYGMFGRAKVKHTKYKLGEYPRPQTEICHWRQWELTNETVAKKAKANPPPKAASGRAKKVDVGNADPTVDDGTPETAEEKKEAELLSDPEFQVGEDMLKNVGKNSAVGGINADAARVYQTTIAGTTYWLGQVVELSQVLQVQTPHPNFPGYMATFTLKKGLKGRILRIDPATGQAAVFFAENKKQFWRLFIDIAAAYYGVSDLIGMAGWKSYGCYEVGLHVVPLTSLKIKKQKTIGMPTANQSAFREGGC